MAGATFRVDNEWEEHERALVARVSVICTGTDRFADAHYQKYYDNHSYILGMNNDFFLRKIKSNTYEIYHRYADQVKIDKLRDVLVWLLHSEHMN